MGSPITIFVNGGTLNLYLPSELEPATKWEKDMSAKFDSIMRAVAEQGSVIDSVLLLVDQLASDDLSDEETAQILKEMQNKRQQMADSILRNTRAQTVEPSEPTPLPGSIPGMTVGNNEGGQVTGTGSQLGNSSPQSPNPEGRSEPGNTSALPGGVTPAPGTSDVPASSPTSSPTSTPTSTPGTSGTPGSTPGNQ